MSEVIELDNNLTIWGVVVGPFASQDLPEWEFGEDGWMIVCQVENSYGGLEVQEVSFRTFDEAYEVVSYFKHGRAPFILEVVND
jgi:hypothetical protein